MYHYTESGLQNVWLENGYRKHKTSYGEGVSIQDVAGLHHAIGRAIAKRPRLTGGELRFLRKEVELSQKGLAALLGVSEQIVSLWERKGQIPKGIARLVKLIYLDRLEGNVQIVRMIEGLIEQDDVGIEELKFNARGGEWRSAA